MRARRMRPTPFALSQSKGFPSCAGIEGKGFDKLSPNGFSLRRSSYRLKARP
jgi:hypothetical protein